MFEKIVDTLARNIGLTPEQSNKLIGEAIRLLTSQVDGARGLLDRARTLGLIGSASEWLGHADAPALSGEQSRRLFGTSVVEAIAGRLHLSADRTAAALGETIPRVIGQLSPGGTLPAALPASVLALAPTIAGGPRLSTRDVVGSWALRGVILAAVIAALWWLAYQLSKPGTIAQPPATTTAPSADGGAKPAAPATAGGSHGAPAAGSGAPATSASPSPATTAPPTAGAPTTAGTGTPATGTAAASTQPTLDLRRDEAGKVTYSGAVADASTRGGIQAALETAFGKDNVSGSLNVDAKLGPAPWLNWLGKLFDLFKGSGKGNFAFNLNGPDLKLGTLPQGLDASKLMAGLGGLVGGPSITLPDGTKAAPTPAAATTAGAPGAAPTGGSGAPAVPAAAPTAPATQPTLNLRRDETGKVTYSGTVSDSGTRAGILAALGAAFGKDNLSGTIAVDPKVGSAQWLGWFRKLPGLSKSAGKGDFAFNLNGPNLKLDALPQGVDPSKLASGLAGLSITLPDGTKAAETPAAGSAAGGAKDTGPGAELDSDTVMSALDSMSPDNPNVDDLTKTLSLLSIEFATGSAEVPANERKVLVKAASFFKKLPPSFRIEIQGHTDNQGSEAINEPLSLERANAVRDILVKEGVSAASFITRGFGATRPVASNDTPEGRARNRRIDYVIAAR
ncbi:OmpA family protein [Chelatococcus reniformis]|uniref:OmpA-like domain-containing protein n=1 Tax=Chelatococcus reniformis TaxID=1494448 RepID=A0A916XE22_9HYPH|nr:OmpA family protein [Chelatococcus reniformis]GGC67117.1 hypothetical protein GCM10010994_27090 [Chelatococcus reniformis]